MAPSKLTTWFLISTAITFVVLVLTYFGLIRYLMIHVKSTERYASNYKKLPKAHEDTKVIVSLSSTPNKIKKIKPTINSLLDQTVRVDQISLSIPPNKTYEIPDKLKNVINVFKCGKDYGACNNIIPALLRERDGDTIIIYLQDGIVYGQDLIERLVEESKLHPDEAIVTKCGRATLVKPKFFDSDVADLEQTNFDNKWIEVKLNVPRRKISSEEIYKSF